MFVLGEMYYGAQYSTNIQFNISNVHRVTSLFELLKVNDKTAELYGIVKAGLRRKGKPIPENDIWIATIAQQYNLTLITRDKHFKEVDGLIVDYW